jgi:hypothetical protein
MGSILLPAEFLSDRAGPFESDFGFTGFTTRAIRCHGGGSESLTRLLLAV